MPLQWRNQVWQSLEKGTGKRCSECGTRVPLFCLRGTEVCIPSTRSNSPGIRVSPFRLRGTGVCIPSTKSISPGIRVSPFRLRGTGV